VLKDFAEAVFLEELLVLLWIFEVVLSFSFSNGFIGELVV